MREFNFDSKEQLNDGVIENQEAFRQALIEAEEQFRTIKEALQSGKKISELKEFNKNINYLSFQQYLKSHKQFVSDNILHKDPYEKVIDGYDRLVQQVRNFHSEKELGHILEDVEHLAEELVLE